MKILKLKRLCMLCMLLVLGIVMAGCDKKASVDLPSKSYEREPQVSKNYTEAEAEKVFDEYDMSELGEAILSVTEQSDVSISSVVQLFDLVMYTLINGDEIMLPMDENFDITKVQSFKDILDEEFVEKLYQIANLPESDEQLAEFAMNIIAEVIPDVGMFMFMDEDNAKDTITLLISKVRTIISEDFEGCFVDAMYLLGTEELNKDECKAFQGNVKEIIKDLSLTKDEIASIIGLLDSFSNVSKSFLGVDNGKAINEAVSNLETILVTANSLLVDSVSIINYDTINAVRTLMGTNEIAEGAENVQGEAVVTIAKAVGELLKDNEKDIDVICDNLSVIVSNLAETIMFLADGDVQLEFDAEDRVILKNALEPVINVAADAIIALLNSDGFDAGLVQTFINGYTSEDEYVMDEEECYAFVEGALTITKDVFASADFESVEALIPAIYNIALKMQAEGELPTELLPIIMSSTRNAIALLGPVEDFAPYLLKGDYKDLSAALYANSLIDDEFIEEKDEYALNTAIIEYIASVIEAEEKANKKSTLREDIKKAITDFYAVNFDTEAEAKIAASYFVGESEIPSYATATEEQIDLVIGIMDVFSRK